MILLKLDNGIPIFPFYDNKDDNVLLELAEYLKKIEGYKDLREANKKFLKLKRF
jgi:CTD small phosphatase-like protein 2